MSTISSRFYAELDDFLLSRVRQRAIEPVVDRFHLHPNVRAMQD